MAEPRIPNTTAALLVAAAIFVDLLQLILAVTIILPPLVTIIAGLGFWFVLHSHGVAFLGNPKRLAVMGVGFAVELVPVLGSVPAWTPTIMATLALSRAEDRKKPPQN